MPDSAHPPPGASAAAAAGGRRAASMGHALAPGHRRVPSCEGATAAMAAAAMGVGYGAGVAHPGASAYGVAPGMPTPAPVVVRPMVTASGLPASFASALGAAVAAGSRPSLAASSSVSSLTGASTPEPWQLQEQRWVLQGGGVLWGYLSVAQDGGAGRSDGVRVVMAQSAV